jgi:hypothetical protein
MWEWKYSVQKYGLAICTNMESCNLAVLLGSIKSIDKKQLKIMKISYDSNSKEACGFGSENSKRLIYECFKELSC